MFQRKLSGVDGKTCSGRVVSLSEARKVFHAFQAVLSASGKEASVPWMPTFVPLVVRMASERQDSTLLNRVFSIRVIVVVEA